MHIVITGGTRGIGFGLVEQLVSLGHKVTYSGTSENSVSAAQNKLTGTAQGFVCDVRDVEAMRDFRDTAIKTYGPIDIWINNAGINQDSLFLHELSETNIQRVIDINVTGMIIGTKIALEHMVKENNGMVYNMEGLGSNNMMIPKTIIYGSSKRLLTYFSKAANKELKHHPAINVGTLQPGMVFTDLLLDEMTEDGMKIARILGRDVSVVSAFLSKRIVKKKRRISFLTNWRALLSFLTYPFRKKHIKV